MTFSDFAYKIGFDLDTVEGRRDFVKFIKRLIKGFILFVIIMFLFRACFHDNASSIENISDIKGTTWQYTWENFNDTGLWYKLQINKNGTYDFWRSLPNAGKWEYHETGRYNAYEDRDYKSGKKMIVVELGGNYGGVACLTITCGEGDAMFRTFKYEDGISASLSDKNPWN